MRRSRTSDRAVSLITQETLSGLDGHYEEILQLTPEARDRLAHIESSHALHRAFASGGFVTVERVLPAGPFVALVRDLLPILSAIAEPITLRHEPTAQGTLSDAARFWRVDPYCSHDGEKLRELLGRLGVLQFASDLTSKLMPLIHAIAGPVDYQRTYWYLYKEGDYLSVHDDRHVGARIDVQFPLTLGSVGGVRVLEDGFLRMHYDSPGSMNILGPGIWHDVPPLLRTEFGLEPRRVNLGFRFVRH